jgi:hypothetical protein
MEVGSTLHFFVRQASQATAFTGAEGAMGAVSGLGENPPEEKG